MGKPPNIKMIKLYHKHTFKNYIDSLYQVSIIFFCLIFILNIFEEVSFFKEKDVSFFYPLFTTFLNTPSVFFEISPFIFFISTQFFFMNLINRDELSVYKYIGFNNFKLISLLTGYSFFISIIVILFLYNLSSQLKFLYLDIKNNFTDDNKYLAMVTDNGLWIKDGIGNNTYIINANEILDDELLEVSITEFNKDYNLNRVIEAKKANIKNFTWKLSGVNIISTDGNDQKNIKLDFKSNFNLEKINELYSNLNSLTLWDLQKLKNDYKKMNYSTLDIKIHQQKIYSNLIYFSLMTILSSIIMLNIGYNKSKVFHTILGILMSVLIYYINFFLKTLGENQKIPYLVAVWFPLFILLIFNTIGLIRINEK
tara:strand:+ start:1340 stop:2443 length:1104 start_codon:yes stop_codon:yes gene_type:complete